jgi:hypothetical protein
MKIEDSTVPMPEREAARSHGMGHGTSQDQQECRQIAPRAHGLGSWAPGKPSHRVLNQAKPTPEDQDPGPVGRKEPMQREGRPDIVSQEQHPQHDQQDRTYQGFTVHGLLHSSARQFSTPVQYAGGFGRGAGATRYSSTFTQPNRISSTGQVWLTR